MVKKNMGNFPPLEVVDRGSETQPQVVENLNKLISGMSFNLFYLPNKSLIMLVLGMK